MTFGFVACSVFNSVTHWSDSNRENTSNKFVAIDTHSNLSRVVCCTRLVPYHSRSIVFHDLLDIFRAKLEDGGLLICDDKYLYNSSKTRMLTHVVDKKVLWFVLLSIYRRNRLRFKRIVRQQMYFNLPAESLQRKDLKITLTDW